MPLRKNFGELASDLRRGQAELRRELARLGNDIVRHAVEYLNANGHKNKPINDTGDLRKSIKKEVNDLIGAIQLRVFAGAKHAVFVHEGTKKHWPADKNRPKAEWSKPIEDWARRKLNVSETELKSVVFLIRRKIAAKGTDARPFLDEALKKVEASIAERLQKAFIRGFDGR